MAYMIEFHRGGVRILALFTVLAVLLMVFSFVPQTKATSLTDAKDTISDSDLSATATHIFTFTTATNLTAGYMIDITFPAGFTTVGDGTETCPTNSTSGVNGQVVTCTVDGGGTVTAGAQTITITGITNPDSAGCQTIAILTETDGSVEIESIDVMVAIIDDVTVSATVSATLTFTVSAVAASTEINGDSALTTTTLSTATTLAFGTLTVDTAKIMAHGLAVTTNADDGFVVTVEQSANLANAGGSDIDSFDDGVAQTTPATWSSPAGTLDSEDTYGHIGFTSEDSDLNTDEFGTAKYAGFDGTTADEVFSHTGPADGSTADKGSTKVGYKIEVNALQEAGDYTNTLTYICTPTY